MCGLVVCFKTKGCSYSKKKQYIYIYIFIHIYTRTYIYIYIFRFIENKTENKQQIPSFVAAFQGIGQLFAALVVGMARNPSMKEDLFTCGPEDKTSVKAGSLSYISQ